MSKKHCSAGFGDFCCIPECKSAFYTKCDRKRVKTGIGLFRFPKDKTEKRRWINIISMYRRKGAHVTASVLMMNPKGILLVNTTSK